MTLRVILGPYQSHVCFAKNEWNIWEDMSRRKLAKKYMKANMIFWCMCSRQSICFVLMGIKFQSIIEFQVKVLIRLSLRARNMSCKKKQSWFFIKILRITFLSASKACAVLGSTFYAVSYEKSFLLVTK